MIPVIHALARFWRWLKSLYCQHDDGLLVSDECAVCAKCGRCLMYFDD